MGISIHAPTWGATPEQTYSPAHDSDFNPRTYVRCDIMRHYDSRCYSIFQSTHLREVRLYFL